MLERMEAQLGEHLAGGLKRDAAEVKAARIIAEELGRRGWTAADLKRAPKGDPGKLEIARRLRAETPR